MIHAAHSHAKPHKREQEYLAGWKRARAELVNYKERMRQEASDQRQRLTQDVISSLISVADNMYALATHQPDHLADDPWAQGVAHVARQFDQTLRDYGVTMIDQTDVPFDPTEHEAIEEVEQENSTSGWVVGIAQRGYKLGQRVLKPAKVTIAR